MHIVGWGRGVVDAWAARTVEVEPRTGVGGGCIASLFAASLLALHQMAFEQL